MGDQTNRQHTFDDLDYTNIILRAPLIKPLKESSIFIPELQLTYETPKCFKKMSLTNISDNDKQEVFQIPFVDKNIKKRQKFQTENIRHTIINMLERKLLSRYSLKIQNENNRF
ncbi:unnamed protein product [Paramecium sonneborni]|uniref:Uncharacterized protein n=1 Tax=Paramecium sonneborni TaxID=65129 RepID=A0A8S1P6I2_9CILI|nr:unnamed protein product [Paramecium sonneborni]